VEQKLYSTIMSLPSTLCTKDVSPTSYREIIVE
jgi:hypothetical protein